MRNPVNPNERDFSKYDNMTTKQLDDILTAYFLFPDETQDIELVSHILEVITERDIKKISENIPVPSWSKFLEDHAFVTGQPLSSPEENIAPDPPADIHRAKKNPFFRYIGSLSAILVCVLLIGTVTAYAAKIDLFSAVVQWTQETFSFNLNDNESPLNKLHPNWKASANR